MDDFKEYEETRHENFEDAHGWRKMKEVVTAKSAKNGDKPSNTCSSVGKLYLLLQVPFTRIFCGVIGKTEIYYKLSKSH
jgi:hypothetical protein